MSGHDVRLGILTALEGKKLVTNKTWWREMVVPVVIAQCGHRGS